MYPARGLWSVGKAIFGSAVIPNALLPRHLHEGLAVLMETELTDGGRGASSRYAMLRRMAVEEGVWGATEFASLDLLDGSTSLWPHGESPYFFGYEIYKEMWDRKGKEGIYKLVDSYSSNWPYFINSPAFEVYGENYSEIWKSIFAKRRTQIRKEIKKIKSSPLSGLTRLTDTSFAKKNVALSPNKKRIAYKRRDPFDGAAIEVLNVKTSEIEKTIPIGTTAGDGLCWGKTKFGEKLVYIAPSTTNHYTKFKVFIYDFNTEETEILEGNVPFENVHRIACSKKLSKILIYQEYKAQSTVKEIHVTWSKEDSPKAKVIRRINIPKGTWVASLLVGKPNWLAVRSRGTTVLYRWGKKDKLPHKVLQLGSIFWNLRRGRNKNEILAIADFDGREEVWAIDIKDISVQKRVALLGGTNSFDTDGKNIYISSYRHGGYDIAHASQIKVKSKYVSTIYPTITGRPSFKIWKPAKEHEPKISEEKNYGIMSTILPRFWVPNIYFVPDGAQIGVVTGGFDISQSHLYYLFGGYDTRGMGFADLLYTYRFGNGHNVDINPFFLPSYFSATQTFFKKWGAQVSYGTRLGAFNARFTTRYRTQEATDIGTGILPANRSVGAALGLSWARGMKARPLSISPVGGTRIFGEYSHYLTSLGSDHDYFVVSGGLDQYVETPWAREHVLYLGMRTGYTEGTNLFNYFFEGGGELLFHQGRGAFLNRGWSAGAFPARRIISANLEYRLPVMVIERGFGLAPLFLKTFHMAMIADAITSDGGQSHPLDGTLRQTRDEFLNKFYGTVGMEAKVDFTFSYYVPGQFKIGLYHGIGSRTFYNLDPSDLRITFGLTARF